MLENQGPVADDFNNPHQNRWFGDVVISRAWFEKISENRLWRKKWIKQDFDYILLKLELILEFFLQQTQQYLLEFEQMANNNLSAKKKVQHWLFKSSTKSFFDYWQKVQISSSC